MSQHTFGPWSYEKGAGHYELSIVITAPGMPANSPLAVISDICGDAEQDAKRIVECVNSFDLLIAQRDELLSSLTKLLKSCGGTCLCGRNESCSVCSRSSAQRIAEVEAKELIDRMVKI